MTLSLSDLTVGMTFASPRIMIDEAEALAFAERFDPQPFHIDPEAARQSLFKGLATSGWFTAAATFRLILDSKIAERRARSRGKNTARPVMRKGAEPGSKIGASR